MNRVQSNPDALISEAQAAKKLGISRVTLQRMRNTGEPGSFPNFIRVGNQVRYEPAEIEAFKDRNRNKRVLSPKEVAEIKRQAKQGA
jgi:predicted DNA-binding transcriptional regulator AlpA